MKPISGVKIGAPSPESADRLLSIALPVLVVASIVCAILVDYLTTLGSYRSLSVIVIPFIFAGAVCWVTSGRWLWIAVVAVLAVLLAIFSIPWAVALLTITLGSEGVAAASGILQRRLTVRAIEAVGRGSASAKPGPVDRLALFVLSVSAGTDARDVEMADRITRTRMPYREIGDTYVIALVPCLLLCVWMILRFSFYIDVPGVPLAILALTLYFSCLALPWLSLRTLRVRAGGIRLYDGVVGTAVRFAIPLVIVLLIMLIVGNPNWELAGNMLMALAFTLVSVSLSSVLYYRYVEHQTLDAVRGEWGSKHPVGMRDPLVQPKVHSLRDGVPGTPMRDRDSCLSDQKN